MKLLYITSLSGRRVNSFMLSAILAAKALGYQFTMACNTDEADKEGYAQDCEKYGIELRHIDFERNPLHVKNVTAYRQLLKLMREERFDIVHCNTPIGGLLGRICAHQAGIPYVIYQAHGFHFWTGAPLKNWLLYYPVERFLSRYTDMLITINHEDYEKAKTFKAGRVEYVPGVGLDLRKFQEPRTSRMEKRRELGVNPEDFTLLSVGELSVRKNHAVVLEALGELKRRNRLDGISYLICGNGSLKNDLERQAETLGVAERVRFLGYRSDIDDICHCSDLFIFMSLQEGLPVALMEAMACGLPVICSNIRGNSDLIEDRKSGRVIDCEPATLAIAIHQLRTDASLRERYAQEALQAIRRFDLSLLRNWKASIWAKRTKRMGGGILNLGKYYKF